MSNIKLDLKQFKHVKSDKHSTTLQHKDGHQITIAHSPLGPEAKQQLQALSRIAVAAQTPANVDELKHKGFSKGGSITDAVHLPADSNSKEQTERIPKSVEQQPKPKANPYKIPKMVTNYEDKPDRGYGGIKHRGRYEEGGEVKPTPTPAPETDEYGYPVSGSKGHKPVMPTKKQGEAFRKGLLGEYAEGGSACNHEGTNFCMHCGEHMKRQMFAEKGTVEAPPEDDASQEVDTLQPNLNDQTADPFTNSSADMTAPPEYLQPNKPEPTGGSTKISDIAAGVDKTAAEMNKKELEDMYTNRVIQHQREQNPFGGPFAVTGMADRLPQEGKPPKEIDTAAAEEAKVAFDQKKLDEAKQRMEQQQKDFNQTQKANQAAAVMGWGQKPILGAGPDGARAAMSPDQGGPKPLFPDAETKPAANDDYLSRQSEGFRIQEEGIKGQGAALGRLGEQNALLLEQAAQDRTKGERLFQADYQELEKERRDHMDDIRNNLINPDKYWTGDPKTGQGGHSKIMAGLGMILAGFNPTDNPNAAIGFLRQQMDANLEAQKQNLSSRHNLLAANLKQFGNLKDAADMTRIMQNDVVAHMLQAKAAAAQGGPNGLAANAAKIALGPLMRESAQLQFQIGIRQTMAKLASGQAGDPSNTAAAEHMVNQMNTIPGMQEEAQRYAKKIVPGVGVSTIEVESAVKAELIGKKNFDQMARHYVQWVKKNAGSIDPKVNAEGAAMAAELQGAYRQATHGGVFKEGEQNFIETLIPSDPAQFGQAFRTLPKVEELIRSNNAQFETLKNGAGIHTPGAVNQRQPQEDIIKTDAKTGKPMRKVPGGWVPVK